MIPHSRPTIGHEEIKNVEKVLLSRHIACGNMVERFENNMARYIGVKGGVAVSSGTAALHLALLSLGISDGDEVIIPSYVCLALLNAITYCGARPVIVDIVPETLNISFPDTSRALSKRTKAIIVPYIFGCPANIDEFFSLGIPVIEDCAQAIGATYKGKRLGGFGMLGIFSFYATKVITTGEGGMVISNDLRLLHKVRDLREYDKKRQFRLRYNYKMTDIQAAIGITQLKKLPRFLKKRRAIAKIYRDSLKDIPVFTQPEDGHIFYRFIIMSKKKAENIIAEFKKNGIEAKKPVFMPIHRYLGLDGFNNTEEAMSRAISIPIYPSLSDREVSKIASITRRCLS